MFGPNARLDVQGSFHVRIADYLRLGENGRFDARNMSDSLLTVAPVESFGFIMNNILLYKGLTILFASGFGFLLLLTTLRFISNIKTVSINKQWGNDEKNENLENNITDKDYEDYVCKICDWVYDENTGDPDGGISLGTKFEDIPDSWLCPVCGAGKEQFKLIVRKSGISYLAHLERSSDEIETEMRTIYEKAVTGKSPISSMRTPKQNNLLNNIQILPAQLANKPYDKEEVNFQTTIGKTADEPLTINLPFYTILLYYVVSDVPVFCNCFNKLIAILNYECLIKFKINYLYCCSLSNREML